MCPSLQGPPQVKENNEPALAVTLVAPGGQRPVVWAEGLPERQREDHPVTIKQCHGAEEMMRVQGVHNDQMARRLEGRPLAAESQKVWDNPVALRLALVVRTAVPTPHACKQVDDSQVFRCPL